MNLLLRLLPLTLALLAAFFAIIASASHKPDVDFSKENGINRFNILFMPRLLTPAGCKFRAVAFFLVCASILAAILSPVRPRLSLPSRSTQASPH